MKKNYNINKIKKFLFIDGYCKINEFENCDKEILKNMVYKTKKNIKDFSIFSHFINLKKIIF